MTLPERAADPAVDEMRRRARRRLVGAIVLALAAAVIVPMLLENEPKPLGEDVSIRIPPVDQGKFVNRLNADAPVAPKAEIKASPSSGADASAPDAKGTVGKIGEPKAVETRPGGANAMDVKSGDAKSADASVPSTSVGNASRSASPAPAAAGGPIAPRRTLADAEQRVLSPGGKPAATASSSPAASLPPPESPASAAPGVDVKAAPPKSGADAKVAEAKTDVAAKTTDAPDAGAYAVQLAAFADDKGANALAAKLKKAGFAAYTEPLSTSRGTLWRVRVGPYPTREAADAARGKLKDAGHNGIVASVR